MATVTTTTSRTLISALRRSFGRANIAPLSSDSLSNVTRKPRSSKKSVSFGIASVREYGVVCDINPSCDEGPSIGLGWTYQSEHSWPIDHHCQSSSSVVSLLDAEEREALLREWGVSEEEMANAVEEQSSIKKSRFKSYRKYLKKMAKSTSKSFM
eukprot:CAMPEP_0116026172 /NCGR_PEP_ID=MMETSP0321-20121206/13644_1 /TAXON_ID=163516 /ORGANISM="Leptocylindrus danicus var. danicus, Strain B650" /LENGTH=154 /DNA_ID=CAMNT_0003498823 /DNA_START=92 /DNA_END=556 /DNA_ORIENTATION=+